MNDLEAETIVAIEIYNAIKDRDEFDPENEQYYAAVRDIINAIAPLVATADKQLRFQSIAMFGSALPKYLDMADEIFNPIDAVTRQG